MSSKREREEFLPLVSPEKDLEKREKEAKKEIWHLLACVAINPGAEIDIRRHLGGLRTQESLDEVLHEAVLLGYTPSVRDAIMCGANPESTVTTSVLDRKTKKTALIRACKHGRSDVVDLLLSDERVDINKQEIITIPEAMVTVDGGVSPTGRLIVKKGRTGLICASQKGHTSIVRLLLERGAKANIKPDVSGIAFVEASRNKNIGAQILLLPHITNEKAVKLLKKNIRRLSKKRLAEQVRCLTRKEIEDVVAIIDRYKVTESEVSKTKLLRAFEQAQEAPSFVERHRQRCGVGQPTLQ